MFTALAELPEELLTARCLHVSLGRSITRVVLLLLFVMLKTCFCISLSFPPGYHLLHQRRQQTRHAGLSPAIVSLSLSSHVTDYPSS
jgi:hypothetical protein